MGDINSSLWVALLAAAVLNGVPLLYGTLGEILSEKAGNLNLGVEGMMYMGGAVGLGAAFYYESAVGAGANGIVAVLLSLVFAFLAGAFAALIYAGLHGIEWELPLPEPADVNLQTASHEVLEQYQKLPTTLASAQCMMAYSQFVQEHFPKELISAYCSQV